MPANMFRQQIAFGITLTESSLLKEFKLFIRHKVEKMTKLCRYCKVKLHCFTAFFAEDSPTCKARPLHLLHLQQKQNSSMENDAFKVGYTTERKTINSL